MSKHEKFAVGGMWDLARWELLHDEEIQYGAEPCRHCVNDHMAEKKACDGSTYTVRTWTCPRVIVAYNEAGYCSTGVCADCIKKELDE